MKLFSALFVATFLLVACDKFEKSREPVDGKTEGQNPYALQVKDLGNQVKEITAGGDHSCAVLSDGTIRCWGGNSNGQLGNGAKQDRQIVPVEAFPPGTSTDGKVWTQVSAGPQYTCAIDSDKQTYCWGTLRTSESNSGGKTTQPRGTPLTSAMAPIQQPPPTGLPPVVPPVGEEPEPSTGTPAVPVQPGPVKPLPGPIGAKPAPQADKNISYGGTPIRIDGLSDVDELFTYHRMACARSGDAFSCWGRLSTPTEVGRAFTRVDKPRAEGAFKSIVALGETTCSIEADNTVRCDNLPVTDMGYVTGLAAGEAHACAIVGDANEVWCAGFNTSRFKQAGEPEATPTAESGMFLKIKGFAKSDVVTQLALGTHHSCALLKNGTVRCWGKNDSGQVGNGSAGDSVAAPAEVKTANGTPLRNVKKISASGRHTCAVLNNDSAWCWGLNRSGQLGSR